MTCPARSPASRKSAERQRRKDAGEVRVEVWLPADEVGHLNSMIETLGAGYGYTNLSAAIIRTLQQARGE